MFCYDSLTRGTCLNKRCVSMTSHTAESAEQSVDLDKSLSTFLDAVIYTPSLGLGEASSGSSIILNIMGCACLNSNGCFIGQFSLCHMQSAD